MDIQLDWQGRLEASERMVSVLQERLESTRSQLYDQDKLVEQLRSDLQVAAEELRYWKEQRTQDLEKLEQVYIFGVQFLVLLMVMANPLLGTVYYVYTLH